MALVSSGIDKVRAFGLAAGIGADGVAVNEPVSILVKWHSEHEDKLYQVYINGQLAGVTDDCRQRTIIANIRSLMSSSAKIEIYAVGLDEGDIDFGGQLEDAGRFGRAAVSWARGQGLPFDGTGQIFSDGGSGVVDYDNGLITSGMRLWPAWQDKGGLGLSRFGESDFGYDGSAAVGFGLGGFGEGEFGFDADKIGWQSGELVTGKYKFAVKISDKEGNESPATETEAITVIRAAGGAEEISVESYDAGQDELILSVS
jgi:hypothetical protein